MKYKLPMKGDEFAKTQPKIGTKFLLVFGGDTYRGEIVDYPFPGRPLWAWSYWWPTAQGEPKDATPMQDWRKYHPHFLDNRYTIIWVKNNTRKIGAFKE